MNQRKILSVLLAALLLIGALTACAPAATAPEATATPAETATEAPASTEASKGVTVTDMTGRTSDGRIETVRIVPAGSKVANYGFDVTPARLVTGLITERGVLKADRAALAAAFPERVAQAKELLRAS